MKALKEFYTKILNSNNIRPSRNSTATGVDEKREAPDASLSIVGANLRFDLNEGFPVTTSKKLNIRSVEKEITWMIRGETNTETLGAKFWDQWALPSDLQLKRAKSENEIMEEVLAKNPTLDRLQLAETLWGLYRDGITIHEGATTVEIIDGVATQVYLTKEHITPTFIPLDRVDVDLTKLHDFLKEHGVTDFEVTFPSFKKGYCGPIYGKQWRSFISNVTYQGQDQAESVDQFTKIHKEMLDNIFSRRLVISAWNPVLTPESGKNIYENISVGNMGLPPCHYSFQLLVTETEHLCRRLNLILNLRSSDGMLGLPFNIAAYAFIAHLFTTEFGLLPGELIVNIGDAHIYRDHVDGAIEYINNKEHPLPKYNLGLHYEELRKEVVVRAIHDAILASNKDAPIDEYVQKLLDDAEEKYYQLDRSASFQIFLNNIPNDIISRYLEGYQSEGSINFQLFQ